MKLAFAAGVAAIAAVIPAGHDARAQMILGQGSWYAGIEGGWTNLEDQTTTGSGLAAFSPPGVTSVTDHWSDGYNVGGRFGYEWGNWRVEEELRYQNNNASSTSVPGFGTFPTSGHQSAVAIMSNAIYDFPLGWLVTPHIGGGIGAVELRSSSGTATVGTVTSATDWEFGYQGIAGIRYKISPALSLDVDYRYLATTDGHYRTTAGGPVTLGYSTHNLVASLTYSFGAPPAPPPAPAAMLAPPPAAAKVFIVFFDWDKDAITPEGEQIIRQAADAYRSGAPVQLQVTGYTDRSGSPGYNQRLSERRANNVARALAALGVPKNEMAVSGRGENDNRVPTAPGVREPQNRRVEIVAP